MRKTILLVYLIASGLTAASANADPDRFQVIEYKDRGPVILLETSTQRSLQCDFRSRDTHESKVDSSGGSATLSVDSVPSGAEVFVDSEYRGTTPLQNLKVRAGDIPVTLVKDGFSRQTNRISIRSGERKSLGTIKLADFYGEIAINSHPSRATIILDGDKIRVRTPVTIRRVARDKAHTLRLELDGYRVWERPVNLDDNAKKKYDVELEKN